MNFTEIRLIGVIATKLFPEYLGGHDLPAGRGPPLAPGIAEFASAEHPD